MTVTGEAGLRSAPFREARFAPLRLEVTPQPQGALVLTNPTPFDTRFQTMTAALEHWARTAPQRIWLAERSGRGWRTLPYGDALEQISRIAGGLHSLGVIGSRPLLILGHNGIDHALIAYAAMSQGMPVAPVSPQYGYRGANPARLARAVEALNPACVYTDDAAMFETGLASPGLAALPVVASRPCNRTHVSFASLLNGTSRTATAQPHQAAKYLMTSGSTGHPKAVICTHRTVSLNSAQIAACFDDPDPPVMIHSGPWSHSAGGNSILHMALHRGGTLYIDRGQPTPARFAESIENFLQVSPTFQHMVPAGWALLAEAMDDDSALARKFFERIRVVQYGGASMSQAVADRIQATAVRTIGQRIAFSSGYGATETGPTVCNVHWLNDRMGLIGLPLPGTSVRLVPREDKLDFRVKGPQVSQGYLDHPGGARMAFDDEGFYIIGDAVRLADPENPALGLVFDGRLSENFKLASGTFVSVGDLRVAVLEAVGPSITDAVLCGEGGETVGVLLYPHPDRRGPEVAEEVRRGLAIHNARQLGSGGRVGRALILADGPDASQGEITDKGYVAQALARALRADAVARLFSEPAPPEVIVFGHETG